MNENNQNTIKYKYFSEFYYAINHEFSLYHSKYVSNAYKISKNLQLSIDNYGHFIDTYEALVKNKLFIKCESNYNKDHMYYRYILHTIVYLQYMHVDISKLSYINLYIVDSKKYKQYRKDVGGEYSEAINNRTQVKHHIILIKDYTEVSELNQSLSLISLFHELTHVVDNLDFNGLIQDKIIDYNYRFTEIKAKHLSEFFWAFYQCLNKRMTSFWKAHIIHEHNIRINDNLAELHEYIVNTLDFNYNWINSDLKFNRMYNVFHISQHNVQYLKSIQQIHTLTKFFKNLESIIENNEN